MLGRSVEVRYRNLSGHDDVMPEDGYMGDYIIDIARRVLEEKGTSLLDRSDETDEYFRHYAVNYIMGLINKDLRDFGVKFDTWTSQAEIEKKNEVLKILDKLKDDGYIYEKDGARWFRTSDFSDDKDRVVIKNDGSFTYLAPDIAYHKNKYQRGYSRLIDLLGPDHHGYINRMKAAVQALGYDADSLDILIVQLVTLLRNGKTVSMSTRKGEFVSLREIIDEIGKDVARFFFLSRRLDSHLDFDIELAKKESAENPVYYIQYAHARICSIQKYGKKKFLSLLFKRTNLDLLRKKEEKTLIRKLSEFPLSVRAGAQALEPNRIVVYLNELARLFHSFYTECRVVSDDHAMTRARLYLVDAVKIVLANGLRLLNISLPEKM
jgi:arginyl-tRNA synthetase